MANRKNKASQKQAIATQEEAREARRAHVVEQYGEPLFSCDYEVDPYLINEMSLLVGVPNDRSIINAVAIALCAVLVLMLMWNRGLVGLGVVLVVVIVLIMSAGERLNRIKANYLKRHGYDTSAMTDEELRREVYVTENDVVVECPGVSTSVYSLDELRYARSNADFLLASFGNARFVVFPRKSFSLSVYSRLTDMLVARAPKRWYTKAKK